MKPPIAGEQNLNLQSPQIHLHLLSAPSADRSQIMSPPTAGVPGSQLPPRLPAGPHGPHGQAPVGYQVHGTNHPNANLLQSGMPPYNSAPPPPLPSQVAASPADPDPSQFAPPPPAPLSSGQPMASPPGPGFPQARQKQYLPPMPGQGLTSPVGPGLSQPGQKQYGGSMPPLPGQGLASPLGMNRASPGVTSDYQQLAYQHQPGYHNQMDMYNNQRNLYQSNAPNATGYQPGLQPQRARRLDPEQMPSPIQVMQDDQNMRGGVFITNQKGLVPPLVTTNFVTQDQGNTSPRYIRSTMYTVLTTTDIIKQTNVPFGLVINPMARIVQGECEPPIADMGEIGPVRCIRCKAYMCPFMQFIDAGRRFQCMFCRATTEVPNDYFQHLDYTSQRLDRYERPEFFENV
ncbi:PREDICTED: protein transport protein Sec24C-like [Vollenhovia emeryi]|uniref:protein transport protein Sec24C-like n=1 Tax=Vollenhovia emeryi TaxID=411798 RepID=UPI0005F519ED|nr:PREDICTED: protein transport protein Sec24C-like [Vollenhovia emeryi]